MKTSQDTLIGIITMVAALCIGFVWIPLDIETGLIEKVRSRYEIGDAFAPAIATALLLGSGVMVVFEAKKHSAGPLLTLRHIQFALIMVLIGGLAIGLMKWTGPLAVAFAGLFDGSLTTYRPLRDTLPWKYLGYLAGSTCWIAILMTLCEREFKWQRLVLAFIVSLGIAVFYDVPFDDLLLPPNGDV